METIKTIAFCLVYLVTIPPLVFLAARAVLSMMDADLSRQYLRMRRKQPGRRFY